MSTHRDRGAYRGAGLAIKLTSQDGGHWVKWWDKRGKPSLTRFDTELEAREFMVQVRSGTTR